MKQVVQIALIEPQIGYLDIKESTEFPLTLSNQEIKDITQKKGTFSKSVELDGTKNNNILLNNYWSVNIQAGTFNINRVQKCQILLNGVTILEEGVLQLVAIKKSSNTIAQNNLIEYTVLIKDTKADLFTAIGGRELGDIDFSYLNHRLTSSHVISTFNNTVEDEYKYYLPYSESNSYMVQDLRLGIFEKVYIDKIIGGAGFTWSWPGYSAMTAQADKTIVPFTGGKITANSDDYLVQASSTAETTYNYNIPATSQVIQLPVEIKDDSNLYIPSSSTYVNNLYISNGQALTFNLSLTYEYYIVNPHPVAIKLNGTGSFPQGKKYSGWITARKNVIYSPQISNPLYLPNQFNGYPVALNTIYSASSENYLGSGTTTGTLSMTNIVPGDLINIHMRAYESAGSSGSDWRRTVIPTTVVAPDLRIKVKSATLYATTTIDQLVYNSEVNVNAQVPKKVKQSDFLKQFLTRYNLIVEVNPDNPTELIFTPRDDYYDAGTVKDWTKKLAKEKEQTTTPVSNSYKKKLILTYKQDDKDQVLKGYRENIDEIYGQIEYTFDSDFIKDTETKELIVSPVVPGRNIYGNVLPYINQSVENNIKLALNAKQMTASTPIIIYDYTGSSSSSSSTSIYPLIHHWDNDRNPSFDLNFGTNDFYYYNNVGSLTNNNLYNIYWRRTVSQIDKGWILTAYFNLNEMDIKNLKFNDKIQIGNTYYNINQVVDYKANKNELTKVELITADDSLQLPRFRVKIPSLPALPGDIAIGPIRNIIDKGNINSNIFINSNPVITQGTGNIIGQYVGGGIIRGNRNLVAGDSIIFGDKNTSNSTKSLIIGDENTSNGNKSVIIGDGNYIQDGVEKAFIFGDSITADTNNTLYANNLQVDTINGISASTLTAATSGDFCSTGVKSDSYSACTDTGFLSLAYSGFGGDIMLTSSGETEDRYIRMSSNIPGKPYSAILLNNTDGVVSTSSFNFGVEALNSIGMLSETFSWFGITHDTGIEIYPDTFVFYDANGNSPLILNSNGVTPALGTGTSVSLLGIDSNGVIVNAGGTDSYLPLSGGSMDSGAQISGATGNYLDLDFGGIGISLLDSPFTSQTSSNGLVIMPGFGNILNSVGETNTISGGETNIISGGDTKITSGNDTKITSSGNTVITSSGNAYFIGEITSIVGNNRIEINSPNIYLNSVFSGTSIVNLGLDEFGNVTTGSTFNKYTTTTTLSAGNNTITHNLGITPVMVQVYDSAGVMVIPNEITLTSSSATTINVASTMTSARIIIIG